MRDPDLRGEIARAWLIEPTEAMKQAHIDSWGYPDASLRIWYVNGPYHPFWSWWMVSLISLSDFPDLPPAHKQYPEAEYEYAVWALDGTPNIDAIDKGDIENRGFKSILHPADVTFHFHNVTKKQAIKICDSAVEIIVAGQSCDSDYREWWKGLLSTTVEHYVLGVHQ